MVICWTWITILTWVGQYVWNGVFLLSWILTSHFLFYSPFVFSCFKWFLHLYEGREAFPRNYSHLHFMMGDGEDNFPPSKKIRIAGRELFRDYLGWYWTRDWDFKESELVLLASRRIAMTDSNVSFFFFFNFLTSIKREPRGILRILKKIDRKVTRKTRFLPDVLIWNVDGKVIPYLEKWFLSILIWKAGKPWALFWNYFSFFFSRISIQ